jgi:hypothetical protein
MFAGAGVLTVAAAVALWQSIDAYRWRDWRRFWIATVLVPLLSTVVYASIWARWWWARRALIRGRC